MENVKSMFKSVNYNDFMRISISIFMSCLCGYMINIGCTYIYDPLLASYLVVEDIIAQLVILFIITLLFTSILVKVKFINIMVIWKRLLLSILMPLSIGLIWVFVSGNEKLDVLIIYLNVDSILYFESIYIIAIVSGLIFIKPWKRLLNFAAGTLYVAVMYIVFIYYILILAGVIYDHWL